MNRYLSLSTSLNIGPLFHSFSLSLAFFILPSPNHNVTLYILSFGLSYLRERLSTPKTVIEASIANMQKIRSDVK